MKPGVLEIELDDELDDELNELLGETATNKKNRRSPQSPTNCTLLPRRRPQWVIGMSVGICLFSLLYLSSHRKQPEESNLITTSKNNTNEDETFIVQQQQDDDSPIPEETADAATEGPTTSISPFTDDELGGGSIPFTCPSISDKIEALNVVNARTEHEAWYEQVSDRIAIDFNVTEFMVNFRNIGEYDNWGHSYGEVKKGMYDWKSTMFSDLKDGDSIYESACGIGLNLFMTLEILNELNGLENVEVYGNEYVETSVRIANTILSQGYLPGNGQLGRICAADSAHLDFVPRRKFDLVFSGYISPLLNPLELPGKSTDENFEVYNEYCEQNDPKAAQAQRKQELWYGKWVTQMVRLAKPGAPIIIEQVSYP